MYAFLADMYVDCIYDMHNGINLESKFFTISLFKKTKNQVYVLAMRLTTWETDAAKQKEMFDKVVSETIQPHLLKIEDQMSKNGSGFLVGNAVGLNLITVKHSSY